MAFTLRKDRNSQHRLTVKDNSKIDHRGCAKKKDDIHYWFTSRYFQAPRKEVIGMISKKPKSSSMAPPVERNDAGREPTFSTIHPV